MALRRKQPYSVVLSKSAAFSEKVTYNFYSCNIFLFLAIFYHIIWGMKNRRLEFFLACILGSVFSSCSQTSGIPDQMVADYIKSSIPGYLEIKNLTIERVSPPAISQGLNFKIATTPAEPLFATASFEDVKNELISNGLKPLSSDTLIGSILYNFKGLDQLP